MWFLKMFFKTCVEHSYEALPQKAKQSPSLAESAQGICCWNTLQALCTAWRPGRSLLSCVGKTVIRLCRSRWERLLKNCFNMALAITLSELAWIFRRELAIMISLCRLSFLFPLFLPKKKLIWFCCKVQLRFLPGSPMSNTSLFHTHLCPGKDC